MKLYCEKLDLFMELKLECANILVIESAEICREMVQAFIDSVNNDLDDWIFSESEKILKKSTSIEIVTSIFTLDFNNKKIQKGIIDDLYEISAGEKYYIRMKKLIRDLETFFYELDFESSYNIQIEIADFKTVLKTGVMGIMAPDSLMERVDEYIKISARLLKSRVLVFMNVMEYFSEEEWRQIERTAMYEGIYLLCFERNDKLKVANKVVIDSDCCRVV